VEGVVPSPAGTSLIIIGEDPLEAFEVTLPDVLDELLDVLLINVEFLAVVSHLPSFLSKFYFVNVFLSACLRFLFQDTLDNSFHAVSSELIKLLFLQVLFGFQLLQSLLFLFLNSFLWRILTLDCTIN
jgi:hypothetical protein